ncbi:NAD(P)H-dependent oxidoreductase [Pontivivens ytuae]|uniref:NAD(P)H-dependent oxidoreductase n=1 Tax=Pontivivens ytuae TaxID=2789856 RepID=A0A7S9QCH7_9RHOB|nr:NAD(P)H-dependent oxidoreductase [Pontivivens ytuae]QPH53825.1 NAD(P)H-dependent oxidoreductase [Pontivivens ytuae]
MTKRIFIWVGHPRAESLCGALADRYEAEARAAGAEVRRQNLADMQFDPNFPGYVGRQEIDPDLVAWQENMAWADHVLFVFPYWWASIPAMAKAVLDKALVPGFGFKYRKDSMWWDKLLAGRTGDVILTSDTPPWLDTWLYRKPGRRMLKNQVLDFCGITPRKIVQFGSVKSSTPRDRSRWIERAGDMGRTAAEKPVRTAAPVPAHSSITARGARA